MSKPHDAYASASRMAPKDPREFEATILTRAAGQLQRIRDNWEAETASALYDALTYNRRIWTVFAASAAEKEHPLPREIKQNIANLAIFIFKRTNEIEATREPEPKLLDTLIMINREIAAGLYTRA
ncbi:flagellar biosynthesis regulator FlaF [Parvibaculum sp.]|jgi:flagellar biosynthesis activator protein FlaF|uniref:flagellar biosynthesis regulator FlaF n=1 Tax=Parvibaculum sp. TaxID=2024848 RepID=UPI000C5BA905|nr:flagellar biosynthesis regulator FlaF [Parvibaculum sp.]MAM94110.1 flagellar protein FlaF [Parvibaculum sp.]HCX68828.1 flagellar biosynthesis regulatory protein FlaF [Rhodobiaceae bacterium]|tara:strand:- start:7527 stop:7904 length:378 start_codon:yes stop_codon:yes gene_type:complete